MANSSINLGGLESAVEEILEKYKDDLADMVDDATEKAAKKCLSEVKSNSKAAFGGTGKYASGWTKEQTQKSRGSSQFTIHNRYPGLPHLLENGHAKVNGGFVSGKTHIADAEQEAVDYYQKLIQEGIAKC